MTTMVKTTSTVVGDADHGDGEDDDDGEDD